MSMDTPRGEHECHLKLYLSIVVELINMETSCRAGVSKIKYHRGPKKQICYRSRAGLVQCLLKHIEMIAHSLLNTVHIT